MGIKEDMRWENTTKNINSFHFDLLTFPSATMEEAEQNKIFNECEMKITRNLWYKKWNIHQITPIYTCGKLGHDEDYSKVRWNLQSNHPSRHGALPLFTSTNKLITHLVPYITHIFPCRIGKETELKPNLLNSQLLPLDLSTIKRIPSSV